MFAVYPFQCGSRMSRLAHWKCRLSSNSRWQCLWCCHAVTARVHCHVMIQWALVVREPAGFVAVNTKHILHLHPALGSVYNKKRNMQPGVWLWYFRRVCRVRSDDESQKADNGGGSAAATSNPISQLQELIQKRRWPPPVYEFTNEFGPLHARSHTCTIHLLQKCLQGEARMKEWCMVILSVIKVKTDVTFVWEMIWDLTELKLWCITYSVITLFASRNCLVVT